MVANAWLRPGDTSASSSCKEFMEEAFKQVLKDKKIGLVWYGQTVDFTPKH